MYHESLGRTHFVSVEEGESLGTLGAIQVTKYTHGKLGEISPSAITEPYRQQLFPNVVNTLTKYYIILS